MQKENIDTFLIRYGEMFSDGDKDNVRVLLENSDEQKLNEVTSLKFAKPKKVWKLSLFLGCFGVSRFVLGHIKTGVVRAILTLLSIINLICFFVKCSPWLSPLFKGDAVPAYASDYFLSFKIIFMLLTLINLAVGIAELCVIKEKTSEYNFKKISTVINV